ncbi:hypothetical protein AC1031_017974 [Aphanomyces cochlioides]|nr:hypothetical protein AC1031_017974 [Aphanomyces cochlioides]
MPSLFLKALEPLQSVANLFPIATDCANVTILRTSTSVMTVGASKGCFQCPKCLGIADSIYLVRLDWLRGVQNIHFILYQSHANLLHFSTLVLEPVLEAFYNQLNQTRSDFEMQNTRLSTSLATLTTEFTLLMDYGLLATSVGGILTALVSLIAAVVGFKYKAGFTAKMSSFLAQITVMLGFMITGVAWTLAFCGRDGISFLQAFDANSSVILTNTDSAQDVWNILHDNSIVMNHSLAELFNFADIVKVPPLATPDDGMNPPARYNMTSLFLFRALIDLQLLFDPGNPTVLTTLFSWDETIVLSNYNFLSMLVLGNQTTPSPYQASSTAVNLLHNLTSLDPFLKSSMDVLLTVYNTSWPSLSTSDSIAQNLLIANQWMVSATYEARRRQLLDYVQDVHQKIASTRPVLDAIRANTSVLETLEYNLKDEMEFYTSQAQQLKLADCGLNGNCGWFRGLWNAMAIELQELTETADLITVCFGIATASLILCAIFASCFATRIQKPKVKTYVFIEK